MNVHKARAQSMENSDNLQSLLQSWRRKGTWEKKENLNNTYRKNKVAIVVFVHHCKQDIYIHVYFVPIYTITDVYKKGIQSPY